MQEASADWGYDFGPWYEGVGAEALCGVAVLQNTDNKFGIRRSSQSDKTVGGVSLSCGGTTETTTARDRYFQWWGRLSKAPDKVMDPMKSKIKNMPLIKTICENKNQFGSLSIDEEYVNKSHLVNKKMVLGESCRDVAEIASHARSTIATPSAQRYSKNQRKQ